MGSDIETLVKRLRENEVWNALDAPRTSSDQVLAVAQLLWEENAAATALLEDILTGPRAWWPQRLRRTHGAMTAGMVQVLLQRTVTILMQCPEDAFQLTSMAIMVAEALQVDDYPRGMVLRARAQALRDHGSVLAFMHRFPEALDYAARAEVLVMPKR